MFREVFNRYSWEEIGEYLEQITPNQVKKILTCIQEHSLENLNPFDFLTLISPAATPYLEQMAYLSKKKTRKRFGCTIQIYAPIYLTNSCSNICTYCGFSFTNPIDRIILNKEEIKKEIKVLKKLGYDHILIVTGEDTRKVGITYFLNILPLFRENFSHISFEVQPLKLVEYQKLIENGLDSVLVYQETYHEAHYKIYHPKGKKSNFDYRLNTPDRLGAAKIHKIGLGVLLGLEDWRIDSFFCALHFDYLKKTYWKTRYSISFPRIRPASGVTPNTESETQQKYLSDRELAQLIFAYRLMDEDLELSLSTRENQYFRDHMASLGITTMSAGSKTNPGGYACYPEKSLKQFEIDDNRPIEEISKMLQKQKLEPVIKDWSTALHTD